MGCSSGRLVRRGLAGDPDGVAVALLCAGSPAVVGALWDVTDKDIDRFTTALVGGWLLPAGALVGVLPADSTSAGSGSGSGGGPLDPAHVLPQPWLPLAVGQARAVCRLPFLVGAAPVVYGLPLAATP
jgi:separase